MTASKDENTAPEPKNPSQASLKAGHRERLRARFQADPHKMPEYELLELLLGYVLIRKDTKPLAKTLLLNFKSLRGVLEARPEEVGRIPGVGQGVENYLSLLREVFARHAEGSLRHRLVLGTPEAVEAMARKRLVACSHEELWGAYLDSGNRLLAWEQLSAGNLDSTPISPRAIVEKALACKANGLILVHNHPAGHPRPSGADLMFTETARKAAEVFGIRFLDHIIITENSSYSMMEERLL